MASQNERGTDLDWLRKGYLLATATAPPADESRPPGSRARRCLATPRGRLPLADIGPSRVKAVGEAARPLHS
jgi:hypothetical protein